MMKGMSLRARLMLPFVALVVSRILLPTPVAAQEVVPISGRVLAGEARTPVPAASIAAGDVRVTTNRVGECQLLVPAGPWRLTATADGYQAQQVNVVVTPGMGPIEDPACRHPVRARGGHRVGRQRVGNTSAGVNRGHPISRAPRGRGR